MMLSGQDLKLKWVHLM